jgi:hypothetical protein
VSLQKGNMNLTVVQKEEKISKVYIQTKKSGQEYICKKDLVHHFTAKTYEDWQNLQKAETNNE